MESKINKKIQALVDADIIEPVNEPSDWISPLVPVLKGDQDVRLCVDMRRANQAIIREKHPFKNAKIFSKLDLKDSFHQLELSEDSRHNYPSFPARGYLDTNASCLVSHVLLNVFKKKKKIGKNSVTV